MPRPKRKSSLPPTYHDRSKLEATANCPYAAAHAKDIPIGILGQVGSEDHRIIKEAWEYCEGDSQAAVDYLLQEIPKARPDLQPQVITSLRHFARRMKKFDPWRIVAVEKQYSTIFFPATQTAGPVIITMAVDLLIAGRDETSLHVHDYKTGWKRYTNTIAYEAYQTCHYAYVLLKEMPDVQEIHFWYDQTRHDTKPGYAKFTRDNMEDMAGRIGSAIQYVGSDVAWPEPDKCAWCPVTAECPHVVAEDREFNSDRPAYLDQLIALNARTKAMSATMNAYVKQHGRIEGNNGNIYGDEGRKKIINKVFQEKEKP